MREFWREHRSWLIVALGALLMYLAFRTLFHDADESSWNYVGEEASEYYDP